MKSIRNILIIIGALSIFLPSFFIRCSEEVIPQGSQFSLVKQNLKVVTNSITFGFNTNLVQTIMIEGEGTPWELKGLPDWITASATSGQGAATITLTAQENKSADESRAAIITFQSTASDYQYSKDIAISQPAAEPYITPSEEALNYLPKGESKSITILANVDWTIENSANWLTVSKDGNEQLHITATENVGITRKATIYLKRTSTAATLATITVTQAEAGVTGNTEEIQIPVDGKEYTTNIHAEASWTAYTSDEAWITVAPTSGIAGDATLTITVLSNNSTSSRSGGVYVKIGAVHKLWMPIKQDGITFTPSVSTIDLNSTIEPSSFTVNANTSWTVVSKPDWLTISPLIGAQGETTLTVTPQDNPNTSERNGTIIIGREGFSGNKSITVKQAGKTFNQLTAQMDFPNTASKQSLTIETNGSWTASTTESWIHLNPMSGDNRGTLEVSVDANSAKDERQGTVSVTVGATTQKVAIVQAGRYIKISYDDQITKSTPSTILLNLSSNTDWTASSGVDWLTVEPQQGSGDATLTISIADNPSIKARTGSLTIKNDDETKVLSFTQPGRTLTLSSSSLQFPQQGGISEAIVITTDGTYEISSSENWLTIQQNGNTFNVTASENETGDEREATITVSLTNLKSGESLKQTITITQTNIISRTFNVSGVKFNMIQVKAGTRTLVSKADDGTTYNHQITISNDFYIGETEVTQGLWKAVMGSNPAIDEGDNKPVVEVSWDDCKQFLAQLSLLTSENFFLPTVAQWLYAAEGGNNNSNYDYAGSNIIGDVAWYQGNSDAKIHEVAGKKPNKLGLYDMSGNASEWCEDDGHYTKNILFWNNSKSYTDPEMVFGDYYGKPYNETMGGDFASAAKYCESVILSGYTTNRISASSTKSKTIGFRIAF